MDTSKKKIKVLAYMDAPSVSTGFGTVAKNILMGLHNTGLYDIEVLGINYWGFPHDFPFPIYPVGINNDKDPYGRNFVAQMMLEKEYDILFTLQDSFILEFMHSVIDKLRANKPNMRWVTYFPIDARPKIEWLEAMNDADIAVTYTEWAKEECISVLPEIKDKLRVIPHGSNVTDFFPAPKGRVQEFRNAYFGPNASKFILTNVARNQQRKDIPRSMIAFKKFHEKHPDSFYYMHCAVRDHGWNLDEVAKSLGLKINEDIAFPQNFNPNQGFPVEIVNLIYNASDAVVSSATGEGWGLSTTEAMACNKPVIIPDNTASTEIVTGRGYLVRSGEKASPNLVTVLPTDNEVVRSLVDIEHMVEVFEEVYANREKAAELALKGYKWVTSSLRWDRHIVPMWLELFEEVPSVDRLPSPIKLTSL